MNRRRDAEEFNKNMVSFIFLTVLLKEILGRVNKTSKVLQSTGVNILDAVHLLKSEIVSSKFLKELQWKWTKPEVGVKIWTTAMQTGVNESEVYAVVDMMDMGKICFCTTVINSKWKHFSQFWTHWNLWPDKTCRKKPTNGLELCFYSLESTENTHFWRATTY